MNIFKTIKREATGFLESYKAKGPASYAAAQQAIGGILVADGFIGIENPFGQKKRPGIFGTLGGIVISIVFIFIPGIFGGLTGIDKMTATTDASVVSVGPASYQTNSDGSRSNPTCSLTVRYTVNGNEYSNPSSMKSGDNCVLVSGQKILVNYDPNNPGSWAYGTEKVGKFLQVFRFAGVLGLVYSSIAFFIRLFSIIFGWKLIRAGRRNAASLPPDTNIQTMISEIKQNFVSSIFGFGSSQNATITPPKSPQ